MVKYVAIGPGAMGFFAFLGAITKLKQTGKLDDLEEISGASAGGLLAFVFALAKGDTTKALDFSLNVPIKSLMKPSVKSFISEWGLVSRSKLHALISTAVSSLTGRKDFTFKELYEWYPVKIHISSYCVNTAKTVYFSIDSTPTMSVVDAVCASVAIPFVISSSKLNDGWHYIDGAVGETTPCGPFLGKQAEDVLTLAFEWNNLPEIKDLKSYILVLIISQMRIRPSFTFPAHFIQNGNIDLYNFSMDQETKLKLFMKGLTQ